MIDIEILLKHTIKTIEDKEIIDWNSPAARILKKIYEDYYIDITNNEIVCPCCGKNTSKTFNLKSDKKVIYHYCDKCIMLFK